MKKKVGIIAASAVVVICILAVLCEDPITSCKIELPEKYLEAIEGQENGLYSKRLPLVPIFTRVHDYSEGKVYYTIHYFPFGTVGMSYVEGDGYNIYNIEKPLTRF